MISGLKWVNAGAIVGLVFLVYSLRKELANRHGWSEKDAAVKEKPLC
jgi:hypothetical protein